MLTFKLLEQTRDGVKVSKRYDALATPCNRLLTDPSVEVQIKETLYVLRFVNERHRPQLTNCGDRERGLLQGLAGRLVPPGPSGSTSHWAHCCGGGYAYRADSSCLAARLEICEPATALSPRARRLATAIGGQRLGHFEHAYQARGDDIAQALALLGVPPICMAPGYAMQCTTLSWMTKRYRLFW